jgi:hypothetical protein
MTTKIGRGAMASGKTKYRFRRGRRKIQGALLAVNGRVQVSQFGVEGAVATEPGHGPPA